MHRPSQVPFLLLFLIFRSPCVFSDSLSNENDVEISSGSIIPKENDSQSSVRTMNIEKDAEMVSFNTKQINNHQEVDLGKCEASDQQLPQNKMVPCISTGTCGKVPLLEPERCRRRYCPLNKVYCLDFDGCMIPDPIFIPSSFHPEKKCPMRMSLCANQNTCQYAQRNDFDDVRTTSVSLFKCSLFTDKIIFESSSCEVNDDCHWTSKCCPDGKMNKQCVAYNGTIVRPKRAPQVAASPAPDSTSTQSSKPPKTTLITSQPNGAATTINNQAAPDESATTKAPKKSGAPDNSSTDNWTTTILMKNDYNTTVGNKKKQFLSSIQDQLVSILKTGNKVNLTLDARSGSILVDVKMAPALNSAVPNFTIVNETFIKLNTMLTQGSLNLTDLNGTVLSIPPQTNGTDSSDQNYTTVIISVTAASLGATFLLMIWIMWNNKKKKGIQPLTEDFQEETNWIPGRDPDEITNPRDPRNHFLALGDPQVQWEIFQKSFDKPGYVWQIQDGMWAEKDWPAVLDVPESQLTPIVPNRYDEPIPDPESKHI